MKTDDAPNVTDEVETPNAVLSSGWLSHLAVCLLIYGSGWATAKLTTPKAEPAQIRYMSHDGTLLAVQLLDAGQILNFNQLYSVKLSTNANGSKNITVRSVP